MYVCGPGSKAIMAVAFVVVIIIFCLGLSKLFQSLWPRPRHIIGMYVCVFVCMCNPPFVWAKLLLL